MTEFLKVLLVLLAFSVVGYGVLSPWRERKYILLAAPLAGIAVHSVAAGVLYGMLRQSYVGAVIGTFCLAVILNAVILYYRPVKLSVYGLACAAAVMCACTLLCCYASIVGGTSILFMDGTDHAGYAVMADWIRDRRASELPIAAPELIYQSWPELMLRSDPRFGAYAFLATVGLIVNAEGFFAYNVAGAAALSAGVLGIAGVFANDRKTLALLIVGLILSNWLDYQHGGYLGKLLAYPSIVFAVGLFLLRPNDDIWFVFFLGILAGVAGLHSGQASALIFVLTAGPALILQWIYDGFSREKNSLSFSFFLVSILVLLVTTGLTTRPIIQPFPDYNLPWSYILPRILDIEAQGVWITSLSVTGVNLLVMGAAAAWAIILFFAIVQANAIAIGLLAGPVILHAVLYLSGAGAAAFQLIGVVYPFTLCGVIWLIGGLPERSHFALLYVSIGACIASMAVRAPRFVGAVDRYVIHAPAQLIFTEKSIQDLQLSTRDKPVWIDVSSNQRGLMLLVSLGRRNSRLQWSDRAWTIVSSYRGWKQPVWPETPSIRITDDSGQIQIRSN